MSEVDEREHLDWGDNGDEYARIPPRLVSYRLRQVERRTASLEKKIDRLTFAIVTGLISLTVAIVVYTVSSGGGAG